MAFIETLDQWTAVTDFLSKVECDTLFQKKSLNDMIGIFYDIVYLTIDIFVPLKKFSLKRCPIWFSQELKDRII